MGYPCFRKPPNTASPLIITHHNFSSSPSSWCRVRVPSSLDLDFPLDGERLEAIDFHHGFDAGISHQDFQDLQNHHASWVEVNIRAKFQSKHVFCVSNCGENTDNCENRKWDMVMVQNDWPQKIRWFQVLVTRGHLIRSVPAYDLPKQSLNISCVKSKYSSLFVEYLQDCWWAHSL